MTGAASFPAFIARRLALLVLTMVLVPSLSFVMFTLIQGDITAPLDVLRALATYLSATFLHADFGSTSFQSETFRRTRGAFESSRTGSWSTSTCSPARSCSACWSGCSPARSRRLARAR